MHVGQLVRRQREDDVAEGRQSPGPIGCQFAHGVVVGVGRRPAIVDVSGLLRLLVSHGVHSDRSRATLTARLSDWRRPPLVAVGWEGSPGRLLYAGQQ